LSEGVRRALGITPEMNEEIRKRNRDADLADVHLGIDDENADE